MGRARSRSARLAGALAWAGVVVSVLAAATATALRLGGAPRAGRPPAAIDMLLSWPAPVYAAVGAFILSRRRERIAWLFLAFGVSAALQDAAAMYQDYAIGVRGGSLPGGVIAAWLDGVLLALLLTSVALLLFLFPDGRPATTRWRVVIFLFVAGAALDLAGFAFSDGPLASLRTHSNPFGLPGPLGDALRVYNGGTVGPLFWLVSGLVAAASLVFRYRAASLRQRQQLKWFAFGAIVFVLGVVLIIASTDFETNRASRPALLPLAAVVTAAGAIGMAVASAIALLRHRLLDIDVVIRRSVIYGTLTVAIGVLYVAIAAALGVAAGRWASVYLAVAVTMGATLGFQPVRRRLDRVASRLVFGERLSGYELLTRFGETIEHSLDAAQLARQLAEMVARGLGSTWVRVWASFTVGATWLMEPLATFGIELEQESAASSVVPLAHGGSLVGVIECGPKADGPLSTGDEQLLGTLGRQAALGLRNARLATELSARLDEIARQAEELAASRTRIIHAQDVERRRIERDLHDGVQQEIVALNAKLRLARNQLRRGAAVADDTLAELQEDARLVLGHVRDLAQGIHPTVLTDRGLLEAVEAQASRLPIGMTIEADTGMRGARLSDDVEAAGYFFVSEALTNVLKHAGATRAVVRLAWDGDGLQIAVRDDGAGFDPASARGSGLTGLRDRIEAAGGTFLVTSKVGEGTKLIAHLPASVRQASDA